MAIGENLQEVVEKGDDICGVSCSVRFNSHLIMVWNRDGDNQKSIDKILERVMECLPEELRPQPPNYYVSCPWVLGGAAEVEGHGLIVCWNSIRNIRHIRRIAQQMTQRSPWQRQRLRPLLRYG